MPVGDLKDNIIANSNFTSSGDLSVDYNDTSTGKVYDLDYDDDLFYYNVAYFKSNARPNT